MLEYGQCGIQYQLDIGMNPKLSSLYRHHKDLDIGPVGIIITRASHQQVCRKLSWRTCQGHPFYNTQQKSVTNYITSRANEGTYPVNFSNMLRAPSVIFSFVLRILAGSTFP